MKSCRFSYVIIYLIVLLFVIPFGIKAECEGQFRVGHECSKAVDGDWTTSAIPDLYGDSVTIIEEHAIPSGATDAKWHFRVLRNAPQIEIKAYYWDYVVTDWVIFFEVPEVSSGEIMTYTEDIPSNGLLSSPVKTKMFVKNATYPQQSGEYFEGVVDWAIVPECEGQFRVGHECSKAVDSDWTTSAIPDLYGDSVTIIEEHAIPSGATDAKWHFRVLRNAPQIEIKAYYWDYVATEWDSLYVVPEVPSGEIVTYTVDIPSNGLLVSPVRTKMFVKNATDPQQSGEYFEGVVDWILFPTDSLIIPSIAAASCDDECKVQPINVDLTQAIKGATIPLKIPVGVEICSLSTQGLITEGWVFQNDVKIDSGFIATGLWNLSGDSISVGEHTVFNIYYKAIAECNDSWYIHFDTALSDDYSRSLKFSNMSNQDIFPDFDITRDSSEIVGYIPGDFNGDGIVGISDLTAIVDFMFNGGPPSCHVGAGDPNGDCSPTTSISDLTYIVDYLFNSGPAPVCACTNKTVSKAIDRNYSVSTSNKDNTTIIHLNSLNDVRGLQLELSGTSISEPVNLNSDNLELLHNYENNILKICLLDLNGGEVIKSGTNNLIQLEGEFEIISATISDMNHNSITPAINSAVKEILLPIEYSLNQNYPNPFNPVTEISYSLPKAGHVKLEVYNTLGQKVATLTDRKYDAGYHTVNWDASDVASGVYLYRLKAGEFVETKRMVLLK